MPSHSRQPSLSLLPPPTQAFLLQIHSNQTIPYISLPIIPCEIVLLSDTRYTFTYFGLTAVGDSPYRHFSLWDGWMEREWSVYVLDSAPSDVQVKQRNLAPPGLKRSPSSSSSGSSVMESATGRSQWFTGAGVMGGSERRAVKNEEVRNALTGAFFQTISRSLPSIDIVI